MNGIGVEAQGADVFFKIAEPGLDAVKASVQLLELMEHGGVIGHTNYSNMLIMLWNLFFSPFFTVQPSHLRAKKPGTIYRIADFLA